MYQKHYLFDTIELQIQNGKYKTKEGGINMFNIAICDDDTFFIDYIEKVIVEVNGSDKDINFYEYTKGKAF